MLIDTTTEGPLADAGAEAAGAEAAGFHGIWSTEIAHEPFFPLVLAAQQTTRVTVGTGIAVAFARSPMTLAHAAWDLQSLSSGRFLLGLGSQIKAHVERRFSMPFSQPARRMEEMVGALRAIWDCWQNDAPLEFVGEFYTHTLMTPFFNPGPLASGPPGVLIAAVGEVMTRTAARVADGMLVHAFTSSTYLAERTLPLLDEELDQRGASRGDFCLVFPAMVATGSTDSELETAIAKTRQQIAFYASTPAYRAILEVHGWGDLQPELQALSKQGHWEDMARLIGDDMLDAYAVVGSPEAAADELIHRFSGSIDRLRPYLPYDHDPALARRLGSALLDRVAPVELAVISTTG